MPRPYDGPALCSCAYTARAVFCGSPRNALELLLRRFQEPLDGAEVAQDGPPARRSDPGQRLEDRLEGLRAPLLAVVSERPPVRLVADLLEELERRARPVEGDRVGHAGDEDLLLALREGDDRDARQVELFHRAPRGRELPLAAVDDDEVRDAGEALVHVSAAHAREPARDRLAHRADVVLPGEAADAEAPVMRVPRAPLLEHDHRGDDGLALDVRHVERLDPDRQALEVQHLAQLLERGDAARALLRALRGVRRERELRVLDGEVDEAPLLAARRGAHVHASAAPLGEELGDGARVRDPCGHEDLRRDARRRRVVLDHERLEHLLGVTADDVLEMEPVAIDHLPVAEREDLDGGLLAVHDEADDVHAADRPPVRGLALAQVPDRVEPVPVARGLLEALVRRGLAHALLELALDRSRCRRTGTR